MPSDERDEPERRETDIEPIPDTMENVARAIMRGPPKKTWRFLEKRRRRAREAEGESVKGEGRGRPSS